MKPHQICLFTLSLRKGGAENQLVKLALFLKGQVDFNVKIIQFVEGNDFEEVLEKNNIPTQIFLIKKGTNLGKFFKAIKEEKPDLIISFMYGANLVARTTKLLFKIPIITCVRSSNLSRLYYFLYKLSYRIDDMTTFNSAYALKKFKESGLTAKRKSFLVNNAITIKPGFYRTKNNPVFTLISIAHFRKSKDYHTLFMAVSRLKKEGRNLRLYVLGHLYGQQWPYEEIKKMGIEDEVEIVGFTQNTERYINSSDALVLSSLWEGTPNAILEGMANYLPIIASDVPGISTLVEDSNSGLLFEPGNEKQLAEKIMELMGYTEKERETLGTNGHRYVSENYDSGIIYPKWLKLIHQLI